MDGSTNLFGPAGAAGSVEGEGVLYKTYWVRFGRGRTIFDPAVENSRLLFESAARAGVGRIVPLVGGQRLVGV